MPHRRSPSFSCRPSRTPPGPCPRLTGRAKNLTGLIQEYKWEHGDSQRADRELYGNLSTSTEAVKYATGSVGKVPDHQAASRARDLEEGVQPAAAPQGRTASLQVVWRTAESYRAAHCRHSTLRRLGGVRHGMSAQHLLGAGPGNGLASRWDSRGRRGVGAGHKPGLPENGRVAAAVSIAGAMGMRGLPVHLQASIRRDGREG